ncbi:MAG: very short patch repair endonuclease [Hyphomicrobiales bacterium]|nr:very short patch repair endonuclease [Hyphomicrobiales bacterium]
MVDVVDKATRSRMMSGIRAKNTRPEIMIRKALHGAGLRFRLHYKSLPGKPDIVLPKYRTALFVNGCFWHGHQCSVFKWPKTRTKFWKDKITGNVARDQKSLAMLRAMGWRTQTIWECEIRNSSFRKIVGKLVNKIKQQK